MPGLLLAPYNDSMRLGQGYNSFLQTPCVDNAVTFDKNKVIVHKGAEGADGVSQVVSYSSRFVEKISDVVRSMNISAGSSIKAGSIEISGNSLSVDETKFAASDLNAVVSVKVVNQTTTLVDDARFRPMENVKMDSEKFFDYYGDCYISGFIEGGDLHGIVSIKVLEGTNKKEVEKIVKGKLNGGGGSSGGTDRQFNLSEGIGTSGLESALSQTETTVTVNWSGGGQIKSETEEWTLDSLFKVAAAFPAKVAACPQRTWAILTKYDNNRDFLQWSERQGIVVPNYQGVQSYASDLLDMYMEYKNNVARIQAVLSNPLAFRRGPAANAVNISVQELLNERKAMKKEMSLIVKEIDQLCLHPYRIEIIESRSTIRSPELWATRLPILKDTSGGATQVTPQSALDELAKFSFVSNAAPSTSHDTAESLKDNLDKQLKESMDSSKQDVEEEKKALEAMPVVIPQPAEPAEDPLCESDVVPLLSSEERKFIVDTPENRVIYGNYRYGAPCGSVGGGHFNDAPSLRDSIVPVSWPTSVEFNLVHWGAGPIVGWLKLGFEQLQFTHGNDRGSSVGCLKMTFSPGEYMTKIRLAKGTLAWGVEGVIYVEILTSHGQHQILGSDQGHPVVECLPPSSGKFPGIKGFYGCRGDVIDRLGPIWGHE